MLGKSKEKTNDELETTLDEIETLEDNYSEDMLTEEYKPVNQLFIPEEAQKEYEAKGFDLQWVRIYVPNTQGQLDLKNIQKKEGDMYEFVPRSEIPGLKKAMTSFFGDEVTNNDHGLYVVGDLALAKFPLVRKEQKKRFLEKRTWSRNKAVIDDLRKNKLSPDSRHGEKFETTRDQPKTQTVEFGD